ncbi:MAG: sigma 54-dependent Fis family transcriptional regulator [Myxococcales bacterium]|nr:sigma 54-dependent Fis family transcriptional regulator [Myxococcales bacterium]
MSDLVSTLVYTDAASGALRARRFRIVVCAGPDAGLARVLDSGSLLIGTHSNNDLQLADKSVSRYHLELKLREGGLHVSDVGSTNGTFHGPARIQSVLFAGPARLRVGLHTEIEIFPDDIAVAVPRFAGDRFGEAVGGSPAMRALFALLERAAPTEATLLLEGETGTGKELLATAVHRLSARARGPFLVVDCGALPADLIGSELFGHARGAFTGADAAKRGLIEAADGGTLFLDEIGELPIALQPQLLRVLEKREVRPLGENRAHRVSIRIVAATHRDLAAAVRAGQFREDLYFRLAVVRARVPPLRERAGDLPLLVRHLLANLGREDFIVPEAVLSRLAAHDWPGNVRELRNVIERGVTLAMVDLDSSTTSEQGAPVGAVPRDVLERPFKEAKGLLIEAFEREYLVHLLERHRGNISRAAQEAGIDRNYIHRLVKKYGIPVERER